MKRLFARFIAIVVAICLAGVSVAQETPEAIKKLVADLSGGQLNIEQTFPATGNLEGIVVSGPDKSRQLLFADKQASYLFVGNLINAKGESLTQQYTKTYINSAVAKRAYKQLDQLTWFKEGPDDAPHKAYIIADPNCGYCKLQYAKLAPLFQAKQLQVRWILVGFLSPQSVGLSAAILSGADDQAKVALFAKNESGKNAVKPLEESEKNMATQNLFSQARRNTAFFNEFSSSFQGTPVFLYRDMKGQPQFQVGMAAGPMLDSLLKEISSTW